MGKRKNNLFWLSYSDLMTSLFFVMLVLFVLVFSIMQNKAKKLGEIITTGQAKTDSIRIENERLQKLLNIEKQFEPLERSGYFYFLEDCKKFVVKDLTGIEIFEPFQVEIKLEHRESILKVGKYLNDFLDNLTFDNKDITYLLVIEGNMANRFDMSINKENNWGYKTSYERALAVYNLWLQNGINLRKENIELVICGSGFNGLCRDDVEENNKRFSIQIIPKIKNQY